MRHTLLHVLIAVALLLGAGLLGGSAQAETPPAPEPEVEHTLSAAYPNPFQARTHFSLVVSEDQDVDVSVYNVLGQRVRTLFSGLLRAGQKRTFALEAGTLPSGIYLYRVQSDSFVDTRRVMLLR